MRLELETNPTSASYVENAATAATFKSAEAAEAQTMLHEGIKAAQAGNRGHARIALLRCTELQPRNESAWLWLASISEYPEELMVFLDNVLDINPGNERALEWTIATKSLLAKNLVQRGIDAFESNQPETAIQYFNQALEHDQQNGTAWLWMASLADTNEGKMAYLEQVLSIEPDNEAANTAYNAARAEADQKLLTEARNAAVSGRTAEANELIDAILAETHDSEDAWVLRSHLADSFEEKIKSFEQVLVINPENAAAISGLDSLRSIMSSVAPVAVEEPKNELESLETAAVEETEYTLESLETTAVEEVENTPETIETANFEEIRSEEMSAPEIPSTDELQFPDGISEEVQQDMMSSSANLNADMFAQTFHFSSLEELSNEQEMAEFTEEVPNEEFAVSSEEYNSNYSEPSEAVEEKFFESADQQDNEPGLEMQKDVEEVPEESSAAEFGTEDDIHMTQPANYEFTAEDAVPNWDESVADEMVDIEPETGEMFDFGNESESGSNASFDDGIPMPYAELSGLDEISAQTVNPFETTVFVRASEDEPHAAMSVCPFCSSENEAQAFICQGCMAMLTLSDLEMLLAHQNADKFVLREAVEGMEREKTSREFTENELTMLGIGHLNLHNLLAGYSYLHEASQINPNNVVLSSQVNSLLIRLEEITKQEEAHEAMPKGKTILVVDDSPTVRKLIAGKLEKCGHDVFCANDGVEAMERLQDLLPDLVLLDITMPRMDGYQVCKMIRSTEATKNVPVVMISGKDGFFDKVRGRMAGTSGYITKPFGPETLMKTVETYLKGETKV